MVVVVLCVWPTTPCFGNNLRFSPRGKTTSDFQTGAVFAKQMFIYGCKKLYNQFVLSDQASQAVLWSENEKSK